MANQPKTPSNVKVSMEGSTLVLRIDTTQTLGKSSSGESYNIATTHGPWKHKETGLSVGLNVFRKRDDINAGEFSLIQAKKTAKKEKRDVKEVLAEQLAVIQEAQKAYNS